MTTRHQGFTLIELSIVLIIVAMMTGMSLGISSKYQLHDEYKTTREHQWVFVAIDAETKLIPAFHVGKRAPGRYEIIPLGLVRSHRRTYPDHD